LLALALSAPCPAATGDPKLDLTGYLAPDSDPGDYRVFSDGAGLTRRLELVHEEVSPKGRFEVTETLLDGEPTSATGAVVQPGRKAKLVSIVAPNLAIRLRRGLAIPFLTSTSFLVEGWGNAVVEENTETWIDGVLSEQTGPTRWTLVEGTVFGQPIP